MLRSIVPRAPMLLSLWLFGNLSAPAAEAPKEGAITWRGRENRVDANFRDWPLDRLLKAITAKTRWEVYVEPGLQRSQSARFAGLTTGEALRRFLGPLSFAVVPATNGPVRLYVYQTSLGTATTLVEATPEAGAARRARAIPNELVVTLKPEAGESIEALAKRLGAQIIGRNDEQHAYRLRFDSAEAADQARTDLANAAGVGVESNYLVDRPDAPDLMGLGGAPMLTVKPRIDGGRVLVGVVDTVVQADGAGLKDFVVKSVSVAGDANPPADQPMHGTMMATRIVAAGAAASGQPDAVPIGLVTADVFGANGTTSTYELVQGLYAVAREGVPIINMSLAGTEDSPLLENSIAQLTRQGIVILAAAGNEPVTTPTFPAALPEVIAVTAENSHGMIAPYANRGDFVDVGAPGSAVVGFDGQAFFTSGTSVATAHASGIAAAIAASTGKIGPALDAAVRDALAVHPPSGP